jgi:tRNA-dihydrouridine synthase
LDYSRVHSLVGIFPEVKVVINGGIGSWEEALSHLEEEGKMPREGGREERGDGREGRREGLKRLLLIFEGQ